MKFDLKSDGKKIAVLTLAALLMAVNIKIFIRTGGLYPGGASGLSILLQRLGVLCFSYEAPYTVINVLLNAFPVYIGFRYIGKKFTLYSCLVIFLSSIFTDLLPAYALTYDVLLISIFGGLLSGLAVSMCLLCDATTGGTDFISIYLSQKRKMDSWNLILGFNVVILCAAGLIFGWDKALYSILFQYTSTQVLHLMYRKYQQHTLLIVTNRPVEICETIKKTSNHGATILTGEGAYEHRERSIVYSIVSQQESKQVITAVKSVDEAAFINVIRTDQLSGRFYNKPNE